MKVEQRIGRVDRIGQKHPEITIYHYVYENTIESDIYDALGERIGMFEDVVGDLQPILTGVSKSIKSATLGGEDAGEASESLSAEMDEAESEDTVEVEDALTDVDTTETEEVLKNARLEAWSSYRHPDVEAVGNDEHEDVPFTAEAVEATFVGVLTEYLPELEMECLANIDEPAGDVEEEFQESIYLLSLPDTVGMSHSPESGTLAHALAGDDDLVAITFDGECASEYPSVRFFLPGDPLFMRLVSEIRLSKELELEWIQIGRESADSECTVGVDPYIVAAVQNKDGQRTRLSREGRLCSVEKEKIGLQEWCKAFVDNRNK
jgi:hypothetical protein